MAYLLYAALSGDLLVSQTDGTFVFRNEPDVIDDIQGGVGSEPVVYATESNAAQVAGTLGIHTIGKEVTITREGGIGRVTSYARTATAPIEYEGRPPFVEN